MKTADIFNLLKAHATIINSKYQFKRIDLLEASKEIASQFKTVELTDIDFIKWYSGMSDDKILKAYQRYKSETVEPEKEEKCNCKSPNDTGVVCSKCPLPY